jgi:hypothetical protein
MESKKWMESSDVIPMFPTLVWKLQVEADLREAPTTRILEALAGMRRDLPAGSRLACGRGGSGARTRRNLRPAAGRRQGVPERVTGLTPAGHVEVAAAGPPKPGADTLIR